MNSKNMLVILGTAHRMREPGKESPDKRLKECIYSREICKEVAAQLRAKGYKVEIDYESLDLPKNMQSLVAKVERSRELAMRVNFVNELCKQNGAKNCLYVSIHVNAAGTDGNWHSATGWQVCVSNNASSNSKTLANCLFDAAKKEGLKTRQFVPTQKYWEQGIYVLTNTKCPAVLTENMFQDNKNDVDFLLSDKGRKTIVDLHVKGIVEYIAKV